jgi:hypothetical protein
MDYPLEHGLIGKLFGLSRSSSIVSIGHITQNPNPFSVICSPLKVNISFGSAEPPLGAHQFDLLAVIEIIQIDQIRHSCGY